VPNWAQTMVKWKLTDLDSASQKELMRWTVPNPLHIASCCTVDILCHVLGFDKSAVNNVDNEGNNILHAACKTGNLKAIEYIIDSHGLLASKVNNKGQFPIVTLLDEDGKEGNITKTAEYTGMIMKMLLAYPEFVVPAISVFSDYVPTPEVKCS